MAFNRWGFVFEGAYQSSNSLQARSGVYVIWCRSGDRWIVLDVGESADVRGRVSNHERADCWAQNCKGMIYYSAVYTPNTQKAGRTEIEQKIRQKEHPPCGEY